MPITDEFSEKLRKALSSVETTDQAFQNKIRNAYNIEERKINPLLDKDGGLRYKLPTQVYQNMLDKGTNDTVKGFVSQATGLTPTVKQTEASSSDGFGYDNSFAANVTGNVSVNTSSGDGVFKNSELLGIINRVSKETGVPSNVLMAVAQQETGGKWYNAVPDGKGYSYGYMMLYDHGALAGLDDATKQKAKTDPYTNVLVGARLLANNYKKYGNWQTAMARYNGSGPAAEKYGATVYQRANSQAYMDAANQLSRNGSLKVQFPRSNNSLVNSAQKYLGTPYVYGGVSPKGFDCSGLMQYVYKQNGINIPRTSQAQFKSGAAVSVQNLQAGDLVFFKGSTGTASDPGHVGMYIGNGKFIQAPKTGDVVKISDLSARRDYVGARRYTR